MSDITKKSLTEIVRLIKKKDENSLGDIFIFFILETILLARLMRINPFDQPAVEQVKLETKKYLNRK